MKMTITGQIDGKSVPITIPIEKVIEAFWPYATKPSTLSVSTELDTDGISANFMLGQETKDSYPGSLKTPCIDNSFVLLDDYSVNLHEWKANRGSCIKLRNGINGNGGTWKGESVTRFDTSENIADRIWSIIKKQMQ